MWRACRKATATAADRDVHSEPHRESPPPQLDTGGLSERSEGDYDPSQDTAPGSDPLTTSHPPKSEGTSCFNVAASVAEMRVARLIIIF